MSDYDGYGNKSWKRKTVRTRGGGTKGILLVLDILKTDQDEDLEY